MRSWLGEGIRAQQWLSVCAGRQDMVLATVLLIAIVMMLLPLPTWMVDILITINLMFSVILLLIAIYLSDPLDLSVFPSLLLITTLYRLSPQSAHHGWYCYNIMPVILWMLSVSLS